MTKQGVPHPHEENLPASMNVRAARDAYLAENGFDLESYVADTVTIRLFGIDITLPNRPARKRAVPFHDLHHVATGYGTDLTGEAEIGAWELAAGCPMNVVFVLNFGAALMGLFIAPRRIYEAFRAGVAHRTLYRTNPDYGVVLGESVEALRARLGMASRGIARFPRVLHEAAPREQAERDVHV